MTPVCHIVCACPDGSLTLKPQTGDFVVACDGGFALCEAVGIAPDLVIGDFDSLDAQVAAGISCERIELPWEKDDTDLVAALRLCLQQGWRSFRIHNALGGDVGHTIAAISALAWLRQQGAQAVLEGAGQAGIIVMPQDGVVHLNALCSTPALSKGTRVSVSAFGGSAQGVCERDLHWEVDGITLEPETSVGVSNQVEGADPRISVAAGKLLVIVGGEGAHA